MDAQQLTSIIVTALVTGCIAIGLVAQAWAARRRDDRRAALRPDALDQRLDRMEQAIDTIAIEIERLSEAHRFTAKLLVDRLEQHPAVRPPARVITPH
jgi:hypothetical protein